MKKHCTKCKIKYGKRKHSRINGIDGYAETGMDMLTIGAGFLIAQYVRPQLDKIAFIGSNPKIGDALLAAGGLVGAEMSGNKTVKHIMLGVSAKGAVNLVSGMLPAVGFINTYMPPVAVGGGQSFTPTAALGGGDLMSA